MTCTWSQNHLLPQPRSINLYGSYPQLALAQPDKAVVLTVADVVPRTKVLFSPRQNIDIANLVLIETISFYVTSYVLILVILKRDQLKKMLYH